MQNHNILPNTVVNNPTHIELIYTFHKHPELDNATILIEIPHVVDSSEYDKVKTAINDTGIVLEEWCNRQSYHDAFTVHCDIIQNKSLFIDIYNHYININKRVVFGFSKIIDNHTVLNISGNICDTFLELHTAYNQVNYPYSLRDYIYFYHNKKDIALNTQHKHAKH